MGSHMCDSQQAGERQGQGERNHARYLPPSSWDGHCPIPEFTEHLVLSCFVIPEPGTARAGSPLKAAIGPMQLLDCYATAYTWPDFPLDPDVASESFLSQKSKPAQHQSIRTGTNVFTCNNRPSRSQCIKQRAEAQKGEGTCLKPHSKLGTEQGTEPRAPALCCSSRRLNICKKGTSLPVLVCPRLSSQHSPQTASSLLPACTQVRVTQAFPYKWGSQKPNHKGCSSKKWVYSDSSGLSLWMTNL